MMSLRFLANLSSRLDVNEAVGWCLEVPEALTEVEAALEDLGEASEADEELAVVVSVPKPRLLSSLENKYNRRRLQDFVVTVVKIDILAVLA